MDNYVKIKDYFKNVNDLPSKSPYQKRQIVNILNEINNFQNESDIYRWIEDRRSISINRNDDYNLFGIPNDATVDSFDLSNSARHKYYGIRFDYQTGKPTNSGKNNYNNKTSKSRINPDNYLNSDYEANNLKDRLDKTNKLFNPFKMKNGKAQEDKYGNIKEKRGFQRKGINLANNALDSKVGRGILFIVRHPTLCLVSAIITFLICLIIYLLIYLSGSANIIGHTPFVLCDDNQIVGTKTVSIPNEDADKMATPEFCANAFIQIAKSKNFTQNATIGTLSYILAEGSMMGTFTYEDCYCVAGPSGEKWDKTLNNQAWLDWLHSDATLARYNQVYYAAHTSRYAAIGLGLTQESDVYNSKGGKPEDTGATQLIERAEKAGYAWQDPSFQLTDLLDYIFPEHSRDSDYADPTTFNGSAEEYCRRVTTFIGMPGWHWTDNNEYMTGHTEHVTEAKKYYADFTGVDLKSLDQQTSNLCANTNVVLAGGNATLADAAVSLASGTTKIMWDCNGPNSKNLNRSELKLYKDEHIKAFGDDEYFASCDRGTATAVRYSGVDNDFPAGNPYVQYNYMKSSDKWQYIGAYGSCALQPGDIIVTTTAENSHIKIYVGNEAVKKRFPDSDADMYAASFQDYFPYVYKDNPGYDSRPYAVFRNVKSDKVNNNNNNKDSSKDKKDSKK